MSPDTSNVPVFPVLGTMVSATNVPHTVGLILRWAQDEVGRFVCVRDVHGVMRAMGNQDLQGAHRLAALITPDGMPLAIIGKTYRNSVSRTCGSDIFEAVCEAGLHCGLKHYLYGGVPGVAPAMKDKMERRFRGIKVVGFETPPFREISTGESAAIRERIENSKADIVWVGLPTPKQERWMLQNYEELGATLIGIGAVFDFFTGRVKRAPRWIQKSGLEWLHRLVSQPKRLWYRYLVLAPAFVVLSSLERAMKAFSNRPQIRDMEDRSDPER